MNAESVSADGVRKPDWRLRRRKRVEVAMAAIGGSLLIRGLGATMRLHRPDFRLGQPLRRDGHGLIFALWHGDHIPVLYANRNRNICVIASRSADGEILARILHSLGYQTVRGSSSRGGAGALAHQARMVRQGVDAAVAVDGPRGPRGIAKPGAVLLAKLAQTPVIPVAGALHRFWQINSWDRYRIPKPFTRALVLAGEPMFVDPNADDAAIEAARAALEQSLRTLKEQADQAVRSRAEAVAAVAAVEAIYQRRAASCGSG